MTPEEIRDVVRHEISNIVRQVLQEEADIRIQQLDNAELRTVATLLTSFGMNDDDKSEIRADFAYLRRWRETSESIQHGWWLAIVGIVVSGLGSAIYLGIKEILRVVK